MSTNAAPETEPAARKFMQFDQITGTITNLAAEYYKPERLSSLWQDHKSGIIIAGIWLSLHIRSWISVIPLPIPSFPTLPLALLLLVSVSLVSPAHTLKGLACYTYHEVSASITSISNKILPAWLFRAVVLVAIFPLARAATILVLLAAWELVGRYRGGVARVADEADQAVQRVASAAEKTVEHVREARALQMQAMQLATTVLDSKAEDGNRTARTAAVGEVKGEVDGIVRQAEVLQAKVEKVRKVAENAKAAAREGSLDLTGDMLEHLGKLADVVVNREKQVREKVEAMRARLWGLSLGQTCSGGH